MRRIRGLIASADPLRDTAPLAPSGRARAELAHHLSEGATMSELRERKGGLAVWVTAAGAVAAAAVIAAVLLNGADPAPPSADEPYYATSEALEGAADTIVRGSVVSSEPGELEGLTVSLAGVEVKEFVGSEPGPTIVVAHTPAGSGPETVALDPGHEYVLLLDSMPDGRYSLVNTTQGAVPVVDGRLAEDSLLSVAARDALGVG
ncbi:hypothetical protein [Antribacter gilvus]|uniref:hypothetical protein n=1 Tax=Antribacter gilvus TaxID=2304675 RepID=UPI000F7B0C12|nr:hypothetical protein [Antribacter gilvus]